MYKNILFLLFLTVATLSYATDNSKKNVYVYMQQNQGSKVISTFKQMMKYYQDENEAGFFSLVDKDNFIEDFMLFRQAVENDFRAYDVVDFDYWIEKITNDGTKKYLYLKWDKKYTAPNSSNIIKKQGYTRLLFENTNGNFKLVEVAGDVLFGESLKQWREAVPKISR